MSKSMNLTRTIDALTRSSLSDTLTRSAVAAQTDSANPRSQRNWVRYLGDVSWQACVRYRHGLSNSTNNGHLAEPMHALSRDDFAPSDPYTHDFAEYVMMRAMIAAAANDDGFDEQRRMAVLQRVCSLNIPTDEKMFLMQEIQRPLSITRLARYGRTTPAATGIYCASLHAADLSTSSAMLYLTALADALSLAPALVAQIHHCVDRASDPTPGSRPPSGRERSATL